MIKKSGCVKMHIHYFFCTDFFALLNNTSRINTVFSVVYIKFIREIRVIRA